jgi:predicted RNA-binding protein
LCEFEVILDGKTVHRDVIYAKAEGKNVVVKDVLGTSKTFENCSIVEVNVSTERLVLTSKTS